MQFACHARGYSVVMTSELDVDTVVLDVDGTLVDSVYAHVLAWSNAFRAIGTQVPSWRIHRAIGMGGDRLVSEVAGRRVEDALGDEVRQRHDEEFEALAHTVQPLPGADDLLVELRDRGFTVVLASSARREHAELALGLLEQDHMAHGWVCNDDVDSSKPAPDLIDVAVDKVGGTRAVVVGDSVWDIQAAQECKAPAIGLRCGGFCDGDLREAGAVGVYDSPADLVRCFDETGIHLERAHQS
jgi:HAD superfamily hydrolase (TIGR01549 family)